MLLLTVSSFATAQDIRATVDGYAVNFPDVQPVMLNRRVMVPVRGVFEHMSATVVWNEQNQSVTAEHGSDSIRLQIDSYEANVNGHSVRLDSPATIIRGRTMVPLRFLSEAMRSNVKWVDESRTVEINTMSAFAGNPVPTESQVNQNGYTMRRLDEGTVIPFRLDQRLTSNNSRAGDRFTASLVTDNTNNYQGLRSGSMLEGHVEEVRARDGDTPGMLGLAFDRIRMPNGQVRQVHGTLIGLDTDSIDNDNGRWVAKPKGRNDNLKYLGYGAGGGALVAILTKGNVVTNSLIGGALGYLFGEIQKDPSKSRNVTQERGTKFGMRLTEDFSFRSNVILNQ